MSANNDGFGIYKQNIGFLEILVECMNQNIQKKEEEEKKENRKRCDQVIDGAIKRNKRKVWDDTTK